MLVSVGEAVVDLIGREPVGALAAVETFQRDGGGAPANVAAAAARLGASTAFVGMVGDDPFGRFLRRRLAAAGVDVSGLLVHEQAPTRVVFVALDAEARPDFFFYHAEPADMLMKAEQLPAGLLQQATILHCGALALTAEPVRTATDGARAVAREQGALVSFAPNVRNGLWASDEVSRRECWRILRQTDILILNRDEVAFLTGAAVAEAGARRLAAAGPLVVLVTLGPQGAGCLYGDGQWFTVPSFPAQVVDTTGAGDAFTGAVLAGLLASLAGPPAPRERLRELAGHPRDWWRRLVLRGTAAGAHATTALGAMRSQASDVDLERLLESER